MKIRSIKYNILMNSILTLSNILYPLITFPYVSRVLQPYGVGKVAFASTIISYFSMICMLGIPTYGLRTVAKLRNDKEKLTKNVQEIFIINFILLIFTYIIFIIFLFNLDYMKSDMNLYLILSLNIIFSTFGLEWLYIGLEQYNYITIRSIVFKTLSILLTFILVKNKLDYNIYAATLVLGGTGSYILNLYNFRSYLTQNIKFKYNIKNHIKPILTFFSMTVAISIYSNLDILMIGFILSEFHVGIYSTAMKIQSILLTFVSSISAVLMPRMSFYISNNQIDNFNKVEEKALNLIFLLSIPLSIYFIVFAKEAVYLISGKDFSSAIIPMQIIMPIIIINGLTNNFGNQLLIPKNKENIVLIAVILGAFVKVVCNIFFVQKYGINGAAISTLFAVFSVLVFEFVILEKTLNPILKKVKLQPIFISVLIAILPTLVIRNIISNSNFLLLTISSFVFFLSYVLILLILKYELVVSLFEELLKKLSIKVS